MSYRLTMTIVPTSSTMDRVLDAAKRGCERWGFDRVTIDDIAADAGISRATLYRMFPGGKDVLFEALRVRELEEFFTVLRDRIEGAETVEDLLVRAVVAATEELRVDDHLAVMLATEPGKTPRRPDRRGRAAHHPLRHDVPGSARPSRSSTATRPDRSSTSSPVSRSRTSSPRATPSTSATKHPPGRS